MEHRDLNGKVAIVTGAATGIGAATALGLARRGANVIVNYSRSETEAVSVAEEAKGLGVEARAVQGDVAKDEDCRKLAAGRDGCVGTYRHPRQQCGHDEIRQPQRSGWTDGGRFSEHLCGQCDRAVSDDARLRAGAQSRAAKARS